MASWAEYPKRKCRIPVQVEPVAHLCEIQEHHPGPCASPSVAETVRIREAWEAAHPGWEKLSTFDDPFAEIKP
jgi:hypothetical protein